MVPKTCKAAVVKNRGPQYELECVEDAPVPTPGYGELLLEIKCTGLCMSDHHFLGSHWGAPMADHVNCAGHEGAGVVVQVGDGVDSRKWKVGDRGGVKPIFDACGECKHCRKGEDNYCDFGVTTCALADGSFKQYIISPARYTTKLPEGLPDELAGPILCSGATCYAALKASQGRPGEWVVIPGAGGGVGHLAVQYASKVLGMRVIAVDTGDEKKKLCLELGAEAFVDFMTNKDVAAAVKEITSGGADVVLVTGGTAGAYASAPPMLRKGGTVVAVGLPSFGTASLAADPVLMITQKWAFKGHLTASMNDTDEALSFAARGLVKPHVKVYSFKELPEAMKLLAASKIVGRAVVDFSK